MFTIYRCLPILIWHFPSTTPSPKEPLPHESFAEKTAVAHPELLWSSATAAQAWWVRKRMWVLHTLLSNSFPFEPHCSHSSEGLLNHPLKTVQLTEREREIVFDCHNFSWWYFFPYVSAGSQLLLRRLLMGLSQLIFHKSVSILRKKLIERKG